MQNLLCMANKTVLVTGASEGLGRATAVLLSHLGARVVLVARRESVLQEVAVSCPHEAFVFPFDLTKIEDIHGWMRDVAVEVGPLDGVVHCAALLMTKGIRFVTEEEFASVMTLGVTSALALVEGLQQEGVCRHSGGSVVLLSSIAGSAGRPGLSTYCASKGAVESITRSLASLLAPLGVRVNSVAPGQVAETRFLDELKHTVTNEQFEAFRSRHPLGFGKPEYVAQAVAFLLSDASRWITGTNLVIDGGYLSQ